MWDGVWRELVEEGTREGQEMLYDISGLSAVFLAGSLRAKHARGRTNEDEAGGRGGHSRRDIEGRRISRGILYPQYYIRDALRVPQQHLHERTQA